MAKSAVLLGLSWLAQYALAKDVHLSWNITWVNAAPNGVERPVIGINNQWPCPQVDVDLGDRLIVDVYNGLGDEPTGIHWHGFHQYMSGMMDGANGATQCSVPPGGKITYDFLVNQTGSYWYHSHQMGQYPDGLRGALIVHDPSPPFHYDAEFTLTLTEWYNERMAALISLYESKDNEKYNGGHEPLPNSTLINDAMGTKVKVEPNKTYLVHLVCLGNWPGHTFTFDDHQMTVVEVDGVYTQPYDVTDKKLRITTGQRMSVLIKTKPDVSRNYAIWDTTDMNMMFIYPNREIPAGFNPNATAWLVYDESKELPPPPDIHSLNPDTDFIDDVTFVPQDGEKLLEPVDRQMILHTASRDIGGIQRFTVNGNSYIPQDVPSLYTALNADNPSDPAVYGKVNPMIVHQGEIVEIIINNHHGNLHPWHLHGHQFQVLQRSAVDGGSFNGYFRNISSTPIRRDTIMVQNNGHVVIRFRADNPGVWLLHCHVEWHVEAGLTATLIEAPEAMNLTIPEDHKQLCPGYDASTSGNTAGNSGKNLSGANTQVLPSSSSTPPSAPSPSIRPSSSSGSSSPAKRPSATSSSLIKSSSTPSPSPSTTPSPTPEPKPAPQYSYPSGGYQEGYGDPEYSGDGDGPTTLAALGAYNFVWVEDRMSLMHAPKSTQGVQS